MQPTWVCQLALGWVTPLMRLGAQRPLQQEDLLQLPPNLQPSEARQVLWSKWCQVCGSGLLVPAWQRKTSYDVFEDAKSMHEARKIANVPIDGAILSMS